MKFSLRFFIFLVFLPRFRLADQLAHASFTDRPVILPFYPCPETLFRNRILISAGTIQIACDFGDLAGFACDSIPLS